jgi:2',3'-cyclic-nucleotide 2'-phosphodiesterase / 3'-nucleotidase / 5'-nucleotidase
VTFERFNDAEIDPAIRIFGPNATVAQDLEPEYIAISPDGSTAYVSLQENNALAVVDIAAAEVTALVALGYKDHSMEGAGLDASDRDGGINILPWPVLGMYQPDTIVAYAVDGATYIVTANEGDARDYAGFSEETRVADLTLDPDAYPNAEELQAEENLGRLRTTTATGDSDGDGAVEQIYSYGARSFTIWDSAGKLVWDSGDQFEQIVAQRLPDFFNAQGGGDFDSRSDDKGGEPEALALGVIDGRTYAFVGLERQSAIFVYDITDPLAPSFIDFVSNWNPEGSMDDGSAGDVSPEGMVFIPAEDSPSGQPLLVVANEFSGTVTIWTINQ